MDKEKEIILKSYFLKSRNKCFALKNWLALKDKQFSLINALNCIYDASDGNFSKMDDIITHLTDKKKNYGRTQVYADENHKIVDIVKNADGVLELIGYDTNSPLTLKGQKVHDNSKIFRKSDSQVSKTYQNAVEKMYNLGSEVRDLFPNESNVFLTQAMKSIREYAQQHKINPNRVVKYIKLKKLMLDDNDFTIKPFTNENREQRVIVITEEVAEKFRNYYQMTEYKFYETIKTFLHDILVDPVNAKPSDILIQNGLNRYKLIVLLRKNNLLIKDERIVDKDENGNDRTATMQVKYKVPKKNFDRKLRNLYIKIFERNVPDKEIFEEDKITEDGAAAMGATSADASGQFSQPVFQMQRRTSYYNKDLEEDTSTSSVGSYQYDVPFIGDKETLSRKNGVGRSISINKT